MKESKTIQKEVPGSKAGGSWYKNMADEITRLRKEIDKLREGKNN